MSMRTLVFLAVLAGLFALYAIGAVSRAVWYDEAITLHTLAPAASMPAPEGLVRVETLKPLVSGVAAPAGVVGQLITDDVHPPLYFLLLNAWAALFGNSLLAARLMTCLAAVLSVAVFHRMMRVQHVAPTPVYTAVFALSFIVATSAHDARYPALVILLTTLAAHLALYPVRPGEQRALWRELALGAAAAGLVLTHYFGAFIAAPLMAWRALEGLRERAPRAFIAPVTSALLFLPWLPEAIAHLTAREAQANGFQGILPWARHLIVSTGEMVFAPTFWAYPGWLAFAGLALVLTGLTLGVMLYGRDKALYGRAGALDHAAIWLTAATLGLFTLLLIITDKWLTPVRYLAPAAPFVAYLTVRGLLALGERIGERAAPLAPLPVAALLILQVSGLNLGYEASANRDGTYWKTLAAEAGAGAPGGTLVIVDRAVGRGSLLNAVVALPPESEIFVLARTPEGWQAQADALAEALDGRERAYLAYSITRGRMGSDKAPLYGPVLEVLAGAGLSRTDMPAPRSAYYAAFSAE